MKKKVRHDRNVVATFFISAVVMILFLLNSYQISYIIKARSILRMEEGVRTVVDEVISKLDRDSQLLNAAADIISATDVFDEQALLDTMETITPLLDTMDICVLMPDNRVLQPKGSIVDAAGQLDFDTEAVRGEHVSNRVTSLNDEETQILRHFVPIIQDDQVAAILYGRTRLDELPDIMNIENIYNASADVFIIDAENGDFLMDTRHEHLGSLDDFIVAGVRDKKTSWEDTKAAILNLQTGYIVYESHSNPGEWINLYYRPAGINHWSIAVAVPEREALESMYLLRRISILTGIFMIAAIIIYYIWIRNNASKAMGEAIQRAVLEEKLRKAEAAEKAKTMFLSNMSHDIRTPMNAIVGFTTLAKNNIDNTLKVEEYLGKILSSSDYLLSLINDVLDMSRIESGKMNIDENPSSISEIFHEMYDLIYPQMQARQLDFTMDTAGVVDEDVFCDRLHINQILLNLLSNANKFTPAGGAVSLSVRQEQKAATGYGAYEIRVKDTGIGMSPDFVEHIFEPFERERNSTISGIQGTGLGMAITKNLVDAMGGTIQVKTKEGEGTEFIIHLEFRLQSEHKVIEVCEESPVIVNPEEIVNGKRLLIVEDSELNREIAEELLAELGFLTESAEDGSIALEKIETAEKGWFDLILMDIQMPVMNGYEATRAIRALEDPDKACIPIVAMTANAFEEDRRHALECGMNDYVAKPINIEELYNVICNILNKNTK